MAAQGKCIHISAADFHLTPDKLRSVAHAPVAQRTPQTIGLQRVAQCYIAKFVALPQIRVEIRRAAHTLRSAGDKQVAISCFDGGCRQHDALESAAADLVDGDTAHVVRDTRPDAGLPWERLTDPRADDIADHHLADIAAVDAAALDGGPHRDLP